jgi:Fe2+ or Zn2+ uptake regulation protein
MKSNMEAKVRRLLKSGNLRRTGTRTSVLSVLLGARKPVTAEQIASKFGGRGPNKVTIYRTLESLVEAGIVHRAFIDERTQYFETADRCGSKQCHPHFICKVCGKTECLVGQNAGTIKLPRGGFVVQRQQVRLEGLCPSCRQKQD